MSQAHDDNMKYEVSHTTKYSYTEPVPVCHNQVHLAPRNLPTQTCTDFKLLVTPAPSDCGQRIDYFGNQVDYFSIDTVHRGLAVTATYGLEVNPRRLPEAKGAPSWEDIAADLAGDRSPEKLSTFQFTFASRLIPRSHLFANYARPSFSPRRSILASLLELTARIHEEFVYDPRATTISTPVQEVFDQRKGVCQDFAHFEIACLRSLGLAARYVSGYLRTIPPPGAPRLIGADASHAWLSVFCGPLGWIDFDPTNNAIPSSDHLTIGWGRDYGDVCPLQGVFVGGGQHEMSVFVDVTPQDDKQKAPI